MLNSNVRVASGRHAGAIAGWLNEQGEPEFAYPEIAGYYLSWLAFARSHGRELDMREAATAVVHWVDTVTSTDHPPATRYYFVDCEDWRNSATFTFDLAMLCRGLYAVRGLVAEQPRKHLLQKLLRHAMPAGDVLPVCINIRGELPDCWSTKPGPFQLKTAAALLSFQDHPALWKTFHTWNGRVLDGVHDGELHAAFYALEGLVQFGVCGKPESIREAANCFEVLFERIDDARSDVIAQGLRLGSTLRSLGFLQAKVWDDRLAELRLRLEPFVSDSGAVSFRPAGHRPVHFNTWAAIFAHQCFIYSHLTPAEEAIQFPAKTYSKE